MFFILANFNALDICDFRYVGGLAEMSFILIFKYAIKGAHAQNSKYIPKSDVLMETPISSGIQLWTGH